MCSSLAVAKQPPIFINLQPATLVHDVSAIRTQPSLCRVCPKVRRSCGSARWVPPHRDWFALTGGTTLRVPNPLRASEIRRLPPTQSDEQLNAVLPGTRSARLLDDPQFWQVSETLRNVEAVAHDKHVLYGETQKIHIDGHYRSGRFVE